VSVLLLYAAEQPNLLLVQDNLPVCQRCKEENFAAHAKAASNAIKVRRR
jgi:hypothetical protein